MIETTLAPVIGLGCGLNGWYSPIKASMGLPIELMEVAWTTS